MTAVEEIIVQWIRENFEQTRSLTCMKYLDPVVGEVNVDSCLYKSRKSRDIIYEMVSLSCFDKDHEYIHSFLTPPPEDPAFLDSCIKGLRFTRYILDDDRWMRGHGFSGDRFIRYWQTFLGKDFHWRLSFERQTHNKIRVDVHMDNHLSSCYQWEYNINILPYCVGDFFKDELLENVVSLIGLDSLEILQSVPKQFQDILVKGAEAVYE